MKYSVIFQVKEHDWDRPNAVCQDEVLHVQEPTWIPSPGDSITMQYGGQPRVFIVLTRHFTYTDPSATYIVNVVMRSATKEEMEPRLKA